MSDTPPRPVDDLREGEPGAVPEVARFDRRRFGKLVAAAGGAAAIGMLSPRWKAPFVEVARLYASNDLVSRPAAPGETADTNSSCDPETGMSDSELWVTQYGDVTSAPLGPGNPGVSVLSVAKSAAHPGKFEIRPALVQGQRTRLVRPTGTGDTRVVDPGVHRVDVQVGAETHELRLKLEMATTPYFTLTVDFCHKR